MKGKLLDEKRGSKGMIFKNKSVKSLVESPKGNNNNSNAIDVNVQRCEIRHAIIQFRIRYINPRLPFQETKKSNRVIDKCSSNRLFNALTFFLRRFFQSPF